MRETGVKILIESITEYGFAFVSHMIVTEKHVGESKYHLVDGAHRWTAVCRLGQSEDQIIQEKFKNFIFKCYVLPALTREQEMALAYGNFDLFNIYSNK